MSILKAKAPDVMCAATGFHRNNAGRQPNQKVHQPMSLNPLAEHDCSCLVQPGKTANGLAKINAQNFDVHQMLLSPPIPAIVTAVGWEGSSSHYFNPTILAFDGFRCRARSFCCKDKNFQRLLAEPHNGS